MGEKARARSGYRWRSILSGQTVRNHPQTVRGKAVTNHIMETTHTELRERRRYNIMFKRRGEEETLRQDAKLLETPYHELPETRSSLGWVRHLAYEIKHPIYAIGNQTLAKEVGIPTVVQLVSRHSETRGQWPDEKQPDGECEQLPNPQEHLTLLADLSSDTDECLSVDITALGDIDRSDQYHGRESNPAVENREVDGASSDCCEPVADGGYPISEEISPGDISELASFLRDIRNAPAYELTYTENGKTKTDLLYNASVNAVRLERPEDRPALSCTPLESGADQFIVDFDAITRLSVVDPPPETYTKNADTPSEMAKALSRQAKAKPDAVPVSSILSLLERDLEAYFAEERVMKALRRVAAKRPEECIPAIPILHSLLNDPDFTEAPDALPALRHIGTEAPGDIAPIAETICPYLGSDIVRVRREAAKCLSVIADDYPDDVVGAVGGLSQIIRRRADGQEAAVVALYRVSKEFPEEVEPATDALAAVAQNESISDETRLYATAGLGQVVDNSPDAAIDLVDDLVKLFDEDDDQLRNNAVALMYDIAAIHTDQIEPHVEDIAPLLMADNKYTRINASGALARVAVDFPVSVERMGPTFIELLFDDDPSVRENACWFLGRLRVSDARDALQDRAATDSNPDVRMRAQWALGQIEETSD